MSIGDFNALARRIAARHDPAELHLAGVNLWSFFRLMLFYAHERRHLPAMRHLMGAAAAPLGAPPPAADGDLGRRLSDGFLSGKLAGRPDVLVVQLAADYGRDAAGHPVDPLYRGAEAAFGATHRVAALLLAHPALPAADLPAGTLVLAPLHRPFVAEPADLARFGAALAPRIAMANAALGAPLLSAAEILAWALRLFGLRPALRAALVALQPRVIVLQSYLRLEHLALLSVAREIGVPVIDHQHGMFADGADLYLSYPPIPGPQIDPTPDVFWFWGDFFAGLAPTPPPHVRLVAGGDLRRMAGRETPTPPARADDPARRTILYLHQGTLAAYEPRPSPVLPACIADAIAASPPGWRWRVRLHPRFAAQAPAVEQAFARGDGPAVEAAEPSAAPLAAALDGADIVVTGFSAGAIDAHERGKRVILHHPLAQGLFARCIEDGEMVYAPTAAEIVAAIAAGGPAPATRHVDVDPARARAALAAILP